MLKEKGFVTALEEKGAVVRIIRERACGNNCGGCAGEEGEKTVFVHGRHPGLSEGDEVDVLISDPGIVRAGFVLFIVPVLALIAGYAAGDMLYSRGMAGSLLLFALSLAAALFYGNRKGGGIAISKSTADKLNGGE